MPYIGNPIYQSAFVTDTFSGTGSQTAFTMSVSPAGTTNVLVVVSGVVQDPSTYGVVGNTLNFSTAPPSGTGNISCRYLGVPVTGVTTTAYRTLTEFTATSGQTTFTPPSYTVGYILVFRNGVLLGSADYTASNGTTVVLATGATAGDLITTESFYVSSVLNAISTSGGNVTGPLNISGSVGIGLTSPSQKLQVVGNIVAQYSGNDSAMYLSCDGSASRLISTYGSTGSYLPLTFLTGGSEQMRLDTSGNLKLSSAGTSILNSNGRPMLNQTGGILQVIYANFQIYSSTTSSTFVDTGVSASITPASTSSKILITYGLFGLGANGATGVISLGLTDGSNNVLYYSDSLLGYGNGASQSAGEGNGQYLHSPATTSSFTYKVRIKANSGTAAWGNYTGGASQVTHFITLMEIAG